MFFWILKKKTFKKVKKRTSL